MIPALLTPNEAARLLALDELHLLDTPADPTLDGLVRSAAMMIGCPIALVSLVARDRQWFKASAGLDVCQTHRDVSFCAHAILGDDLFVVPDASTDPRFHDNPHVVGEPHVRFYAGAPLVVDGHALGTLCVIDQVPRDLSAAQRGLLRDLARAVEHWIVSWGEHKQLRETQSFMTRIARHVPGVFYQYRRAADGSSRFPFASEGIREVYELSPEEVQRDARAVFERLHPQDVASVHAAIEQSARSLSPWCQQYRVVLPVAGERWLEGRATPERIDDGSVLWCGFIQDITERRAAEQVLREDFASRRASQAKSEFLSRISHELRTPLNAVLGFTQLLQADERLPAFAQRQLDQVRQAGTRLLGLVDDLLDLTRLERGVSSPTAVPLDVMPVVAASLAAVGPLALQRGVRVMPVSGETVALVRADAKALRQVLQILLSNAVKFNREGGAIWAETRCTDTEVGICIADEGPGLSPQQREQLFQPLERLGAETSQVPGSGLGLAIARQLVHALQGRIEVGDRAGGGCCFEVWLPRSRARLAESSVVLAPASRVGGQPQALARRPLVLCVEDNPINAMLLNEAIEAHGGCEVLSAADGSEALGILSMHRPDLMLSDIGLPYVDGLDLVRAVRGNATLASMRCIALSGDALPEARRCALQAGYDGYWTKPLVLELLDCELDRLAQNDRSGS